MDGALAQRGAVKKPRIEVAHATASFISCLPSFLVTATDCYLPQNVAAEWSLHGPRPWGARDEAACLTARVVGLVGVAMAGMYHPFQQLTDRQFTALRTNVLKCWSKADRVARDNPHLDAWSLHKIIAETLRDSDFTRSKACINAIATLAKINITEGITDKPSQLSSAEMCAAARMPGYVRRARQLDIAETTLAEAASAGTGAETTPRDSPLWRKLDSALTAHRAAEAAAAAAASNCHQDQKNVVGLSQSHASAMSAPAVAKATAAAIAAAAAAAKAAAAATAAAAGAAEAAAAATAAAAGAAEAAAAATAAATGAADAAAAATAAAAAADKAAAATAAPAPLKDGIR